MSSTRIDGRCFWLRQVLQPGAQDEPALRGAARADICIVGGGYAGLWTALELKQRDPSLQIVIVEADICGGGASGRNSGMVLPQWVKFEALVQLCGVDGALALCRASTQVLDEMEAFCGAQGIDVGWRRSGWIWGATCGPQAGSWNGVLCALEAAGEQPFRHLSGAQIRDLTGSSGFVEGVLLPQAATLQPAALVRGLRRVALERGVVIHENTPMVRLDRASPPVVHTPDGAVTARRVILTMNAWSMQLPELRPGILVIASDDAITAPAADTLTAAGYAAAPLMTDSQTFVTGFRTTADARLVAGVTGGTVGFGTIAGNQFEGRSHREAAIRAALQRGHRALADLPFIDSWSGPIDRTRNGLPLFGHLPGCRDVIYGYGFSGNGVATAPLAARVLASLALEVQDEWSQCGLVRPVEAWMPPEPLRYVGALMVRGAVRRKDRLAYANRKPDPLTRALAALAPGGIVTTRLRNR